MLEISDRVSVLRKGEFVGTVETQQATEQSLTEMMVGREVELNIAREEPVSPTPRLIVKGLTCVDKYGAKSIDDVTFTAYGGEILGIAGIAGAGQKTLLETIAGLETPVSGSITFIDPRTGKEEALVGCTPRQIRDMGVALSVCAGGPAGHGLVGAMGMTGNMMLRSYRDGRSLFAQTRKPRELSRNIIEKLNVMTPSVSTPVRRLSGGNVQKVLVGREIANSPAVLMTAYAVRGLDINTSYTIYRLLGEEKQRGSAVIFVGEDLDVLLALCDKVLVLCGGRVTGMVDARSTTKAEIGLLMTSLRQAKGQKQEGQVNEKASSRSARAVRAHGQTGYNARLAAGARICAGGRVGARCLLDYDCALYGPQSDRRVCYHVGIHVWRAWRCVEKPVDYHLDNGPRYDDPPVRSACVGACVSHAVLEYRRGRTDSRWRAGNGVCNAPVWRYDTKLGALCGHGECKPVGRACVGVVAGSV